MFILMLQRIKEKTKTLNERMCLCDHLKRPHWLVLIVLRLYIRHRQLLPLTSHLKSLWTFLQHLSAHVFSSRSTKDRFQMAASPIHHSLSFFWVQFWWQTRKSLRPREIYFFLKCIFFNGHLRLTAKASQSAQTCMIKCQISQLYNN